MHRRQCHPSNSFGSAQGQGSPFPGFPVSILPFDKYRLSLIYSTPVTPRLRSGTGVFSPFFALRLRSGSATTVHCFLSALRPFDKLLRAVLLREVLRKYKKKPPRLPGRFLYENMRLIDYKLLMALRSSKATCKRAIRVSSPFLIQTRGS